MTSRFASRSTAIFALGALIGLGHSGDAAAQEPARTRGAAYLLTNGTIIDGRGGPPREDQAIYVESGHILAVGAPSQMALPQGLTVVDMQGKWLVPGYIDTHVHARDSVTLRRMLAVGITTVRSPTSVVVDGVDYRRYAQSRNVPAPRVFASGPILDTPPGRWPDSRLVTTEEEIRAAIREQADAEVDFVSLSIGLPPTLVDAAIDEAHDADLEVAGDLVATSWIEAGRRGIDHLMNVVSRNPALLPESVRESYEADVSAGDVHASYRWLELLDLDGPEVDAMLTALLSRDVTVEPLLVATEAVLFCGTPEYSEFVARFYENGPDPTESVDCPSEAGAADFHARAREAWPKALRLVELLHDQGVRLLAGSNSPFGLIPAGHSYHRELQLLVDAGVPELEVIGIATRNAASSLGILHQTGTIEADKRADIVALRADPTENISAARDIVWVMKDGRFFVDSREGQPR